MDDLGPEDFDTRHLTRKAWRRKLLLAGFLLLVGGLVGGVLGWTSEEPVYRARGLIYIQQHLISSANPTGERGMPMFEGYVAYQAALLASRRCALLAMATETWGKAGEPRDPEAVAAFEARTSIVRPEGQPHIQVCFEDPRPDVAVAGVRALIEAYTKLSEDLNDANEKLEYARAQVDVLGGKQKTTTDQILVRTAEYGGVEGLEIRHRAAIKQLLDVEDQLARVRQMLRDHKSDAGPDGNAPKKAGEIALENPEVAKILLDLDVLEAEERYLAQQRGKQNPALAALRRKIAARKKRIEQLAEAWNRVRATKALGGLSSAQLEDREQRLVAHLEALRARTRRIGETRAGVARLQAAQADLLRQLADMEAMKEQLTSQLTGKGRIRIPDPGSRPTEYFRDPRSRHFAWGAALGALPGLLLLLFFAFRAKPRSPLPDAA